MNADKYSHQLARLQTSKASSIEDTDYLSLRNDVKKELETLQKAWTPKNSRLLHLGTLLAAFSYLLALIKAIIGAVAT
jgi:hypothetical protein